jgi:hypothetical protein
MSLEDNPPDHELDVSAARIIYPDGSFLKIQPDVSTPYHGHRFTTLLFPGARAGCLVELTYSFKEAANTQIPWLSQDIILQHDIPIASAQLQLRVPLQQKFQHKLYRNKTEPKTSESSHSKVLLFEFGAIPALESLPYDPPLAESAIRIQITSLKSWTEFAEWSKRMLNKSDTLDEETRKLVKQLTAKATTDTEKVRALYDFLCELRYETKPVGVRAFRPRSPDKVCSERYGDCKDKANALVAMAKEVGVTGYFVLLNRQLYTDPDFPSWQFNHAIAFFPQLTGFPNGLWLDATDGSTPFATLPPGDVGRQAFVLESPEPKFREVTLPSGERNGIHQTLSLLVNPEGEVSGTMRVETTGLSDYSLRQSFKGLGPLQARSRFQQLIDAGITGLSGDTPSFLSPKDLGKPFFVEGKVRGSSWKYVLSQISPPLDVWKYISSTTRDRTLVMNDGQPFTLHQTIRVQNPVFDIAPLTWEKESSHLKTKVSYMKEMAGWTRESTMQVLTPKILPEEYAAFRAQVMEWLHQMQHHQSPTIPNKTN